MQRDQPLGFHDNHEVMVEIGKAKMLRSRHLMVRTL